RVYHFLRRVSEPFDDTGARQALEASEDLRRADAGRAYEHQACIGRDPAGCRKRVDENADILPCPHFPDEEDERRSRQLELPKYLLLHPFGRRRELQWDAWVDHVDRVGGESSELDDIALRRFRIRDEPSGAAADPSNRLLEEETRPPWEELRVLERHEVVNRCNERCRRRNRNRGNEHMEEVEAPIHRANARQPQERPARRRRLPRPRQHDSLE